MQRQRYQLLMGDGRKCSKSSNLSVSFFPNVGNTRVENTFKKMSLSEMLFVPNFLAESYQQLNQIKDINDKVWLELVGYYGWSKVAKAISSHFWLPPNPKHQYLQQIQTQQSHISFYYPCCKYPQTVEISGLP